MQEAAAPNKHNSAALASPVTPPTVPLFGSSNSGPSGDLRPPLGSARDPERCLPRAAAATGAGWATRRVTGRRCRADALLAILGKLDHIDILRGAELVCRSWRHAARDEPELWRRINMLYHAELFFECDLHALARTAVRRSAGLCEAFWGEYAGDDRLILYLADRAPLLKSLRFISCYDVCQEAFMEAMTKFPLLEELELSICPNVYGEAFAVVGASCPNLKRFRLSKNVFVNIEGGSRDKDEEAMGIAKMHELRSLQLFNCELTNAGMTAILDGCPNLESLDIRQCFNVKMDRATICAKCPRIETLKLPHDSTAGYEFQVHPPQYIVRRE